MIFNYAYGGIKIVEITINGAPNEVVTLTPTKAGLKTIKVTLNEKGVYTGEVSKDKYTFVGEISKEAISSLTYEVEDGGVYNLWGTKRAIFWYGREITPFRYHIDNSRCSCYNSGEFIYCGSYIDKYNITAYMTDTTNAMTTSLQDTSEYSKINYIIEPLSFTNVSETGYTRFYYGYASSYTYSLGNYKNSTASKALVTVNSPGTSVYIGVGSIMEAGTGLYGNPGKVEGRCYAIWLE